MPEYLIFSRKKKFLTKTQKKMGKTIGQKKNLFMNDIQLLGHIFFTLQSFFKKSFFQLHLKILLKIQNILRCT